MTLPRLERIERMVGPEGIARLQSAHVAVIGLGAVGSYAVEALARAGVGRLRLVDFDIIRQTNINRQLYALESTMGMPKTQVARERVLQINPCCEVETLRVFVHTDTMQQTLAGPPHLIVDAIDAVNPKVELLAAAVQRGIPIVSSMGAALRTDPTAVRVGPLSNSVGCPLAKRVRVVLRRRGVPLQFQCVYSVEPADPIFVGEPDDDMGGEGGCTGRGRSRRVLGSLPTMTGVFSLVAANTALRMILGDLFPGEHRR